jgi:hypothetical protein
LSLVKSRGRYFFVKRKEDVQEGSDPDLQVVKRGYSALGIQWTKLILVPRDQMGHYGSYDPAMFEQAMTFLDEPLSKLPPKATGKPGIAATAPATATAGPAATEAKPSASKPTGTTQTSPAIPPVSPANDAAEKAAKDLSMVKNYLAAQKYDAALQKIVETYPGTPAAKEAQKLLKEIEGK